LFVRLWLGLAQTIRSCRVVLGWGPADRLRTGVVIFTSGVCRAGWRTTPSSGD